MLLQNRQLRTVLATAHVQGHGVLTPPGTGSPVGARDTVLTQVGQQVVGRDDSRGREVRYAVLTDIAAQLVLLEPVDEGLDAIDTDHRVELLGLVEVVAREILVHVHVRFINQVVLRITHPRVGDQLGVVVRPVEGARPAIARYVDPALGVDGADCLSSSQGSLRPEPIGGVRLVHQAVTLDGRMVDHLLHDLLPHRSEGTDGHFFGADQLAVVTVVVVQVENHLDVVLLREVQRLLQTGELLSVERRVQLGLDSLPEERQANQRHAQVGVLLVVRLGRVGVVGAMLARNNRRAEACAGQVDANQQRLAVGGVRCGRRRRRCCFYRRSSQSRRRRSAGRCADHRDGLRITQGGAIDHSAVEKDAHVAAHQLSAQHLAGLAVSELHHSASLERCHVGAACLNREGGSSTEHTVQPMSIGVVVQVTGRND